LPPVDEEGQFATSEPRTQNGPTDPSHATSKKQASSEGVEEKTVRRNAKYSEGIDVLKEHNPDLATAKGLFSGQLHPLDHGPGTVPPCRPVNGPNSPGDLPRGEDRPGR